MSAAPGVQGTLTLICMSINSIHYGLRFSEELAGRLRICILIFFIVIFFFLCREGMCFLFHHVHTHTLSLSPRSHSSGRRGASPTLKNY